MIVRTFSQYYPSYHPKKGLRTNFVEKICASFDQGVDINYWHLLQQWNPNLPEDILQNFYQSLSPEHFDPKGHTIRAGHHLKQYDWFSPRVWSGKPYNSKQIIIAPDIHVKKTWDFDIHGSDWFIDGRHEYALTGSGFDSNQLAKNDGLTIEDFDDWFTKSPSFRKTEEFVGQIICWSDSIEY